LKKIENGKILLQSASDEEMERKVLNDAYKLISAMGRNADPIITTKHILQTLNNGANTLLSFAGRPMIDSTSGGKVQLQFIDGEVKQALMNFGISFLSYVRKLANNTDSAKVQFANSEEFLLTFLNIMQVLNDVVHKGARHASPNNEMLPKLYNWINTMFPIFTGKRDDEIMRKGLNEFISLLPSLF
jgi:hypothetical protein